MKLTDGSKKKLKLILLKAEAFRNLFHRQYCLNFH